LSVPEKRQCIEAEHPQLSIGRQCELIDLSRASYYRQPETESDENLALMRIIDEEYTRHPFYGSRKLKKYLNDLGYAVNRKRVQRLMRKMGIASIAPKPFTSKPGPGHKIYPYLIRDLEINRPDQVWCSDFSYIRMKGGFVYLTVVMDWHSRYVLSWELSVTMDDHFCVSALGRALRGNSRPEIFNTDQGSQYTGHDFTQILKDHDIDISMDGKGRAMDNIMIERLRRSVKYEDIYVKEYSSIAELQRGLKIYFNFYNHERPHQSFNYNTPAEMYYGKAKQAA